MNLVSTLTKIILIATLLGENICLIQNRNLKLKENSENKIKALSSELSRIEQLTERMEGNLSLDSSVKLSNEVSENKRELKEVAPSKDSPQERQLQDQEVTHTVTHTAAPFGMMTPSLLPPPPPIFSTGKLPVTTQYQIVHYPAHVNTPWNLLSYPRVMAPHYGYMGYPLHPYNYMHMAHAAHTGMLGAQMGYPGAMANPYIHSPYSMGLHPFGYLPPVGMPFMPYSSYGLGGFSSPFPYGAYGSFGYASGMMGKRKLI
jgi:hypothetical protein